MLECLLSTILIAVVAFCVYRHLVVPFFIPVVIHLLVFVQNMCTVIWFILLSILLMKAADFTNGTRRMNYQDVYIPTVTCFLVFTQNWLIAGVFLLLLHQFKKGVDLEKGRRRKYSFYEDVLIPAAICLLVCNTSSCVAIMISVFGVCFKKDVDFSNGTHWRKTRNPRSDELYELRKYTRYPDGRITCDVVSYFVPPKKYVRYDRVSTPRRAIVG